MNISKGMTVNISDDFPAEEYRGMSGEVTRTSSVLAVGEVASVRLPSLDENGDPRTNDDGEPITTSEQIGVDFLEPVHDGNYLTAILEGCKSVHVRASIAGEAMWFKTTKQCAAERLDDLDGEPTYEVDGDALYLG